MHSGLGGFESALIRLFLWFLIPLVGFVHAAPLPPWARDAKHLTGESDFVRSQALTRIKRQPNLDAQLIEAIRSPAPLHFVTLRALAIDVAVALKREKVLPALWETEARDTTGASLLAAVTLEPEDADTLPLLRAKLLPIALSTRAATARRLVAIDALGRLKHAWDQSQSRALYGQESPIPEAFLTALRLRILGMGNPQDLELLRPALTHADPWIQKRARSIASELTPAGQRKLGLGR